jgi:hypothetical protein
MIASIRPTTSPSPETLHHQFVDHILPAVQRHAAIQFRLRRGQDRDDAIQETQAVAWQLCIQAIESGKDPASFPTVIAAYAAKRVCSGRPLTGTSSRDVLAPTTQQRNGFEVHSLDDESCALDCGWKAAVAQDSKNATPADTVAFRLDFNRWLNERLPRRDKQIVERLAVGDRTGEIAQKHQLSASRISKLRWEFYDSWQQFQGVEPADRNTAAA